jgi:predicted transcriptional regulator
MRMMLNITFSRLKMNINKLHLPSPSLSNAEEIMKKLTTKQYDSRISKMTKADLIRRKKSRYFLTLLGKLVYEAHMTTGKGLNYYRKLKALESIQTLALVAFIILFI